MKVYITLSEAAELEEIQYKTLSKKIGRNPEAFDIKTEKPEAGGKERVLIAVDSLSKAAQRKHKKLNAITETTGGDVVVENLKTEEPWYLDMDVNWYKENCKTAYYKAVALSRTLQDIINYSDTDKTDYIIQKAEELGMSQRTLYRNIDKYLEAAGWSLKMMKETGANYDYYKVLCLCRKPRDAGTFPSFSPELRQLIKLIWCNKDFQENQGTREMLYSKLMEAREENGWIIPSYQSVCRYITHLMEVEGYANACKLARDGLRDFKNTQMMKKARDTSALKVMEVVMGDEHTFDCWVSYKCTNGKVIAIRPKLVVWIDVRSRMPMGDLMCMDADSQILKESIVKMLYSKYGGMPQYLHIDNGKDYTSKEMTGVERKKRYDEFWEENEGFFHSIGIENFHRSAPYEPWDKAEIERFFLTVCNKFTKWFKSYTGTLTGSKTSAKVPKNIQKMLEQGKLPTMEEFYDHWSKWMHGKYVNYTHRGLKAMKETYCTPLSLFENGERYVKAVPPKSFVVMQMMKKDTATVSSVGIRKFDTYYTANELYGYNGKKVNIKYDPHDVSTLYVCDEKWHPICEAHSYELLQFGHGVPQKELEEHRKAQRAMVKDAQEKLKEAATPLDERIAGAAVANRIVGSMMIEGKGTPQKVITLPNEKSYREYRKAERQSEYIAKQGMEALEKLRNMG